jgi:arsenate reductase-like glutaredoxin family protein
MTIKIYGIKNCNNYRIAGKRHIGQNTGNLKFPGA